MKKLLAAALAVTLCGTVTVSCGKSAQEKVKKITAASSSQAQDSSEEEKAEDDELPTDEETTDQQTTAGEDKAVEAEMEIKEPSDPTVPLPVKSTAEISADNLLKYPVNSGKYDVSNGATENMLGRAILNRGDTSRLAEKLDHALNNKKEFTKLCFLGDSITAGSGANSGANKYVNQVKTWWEENISLYVDVTNAGIGATDSLFGVHRACVDCLPTEADIIVIEFINDANDTLYASAMDSLVRMCLALPNNPAVIILEPTCQDGSSPQDAHLEVAKNYDIPMISYHDAVIPEIEAGNFAWRDISPDTVHPNDNGHIIMARCITNLFDQTLAQLGTIDKVSKPFDENTPSAEGDVFAGATLGTKGTPETVKVVDEGSFTESETFQHFTEGWKTISGGKATFEITARNIGMVYEKKVTGNNGMIAVKVDDQPAVLIDGNFPGGWGDHAKADMIYSSDEEKTHTETVEVLEGDENEFELIAWLVS